MAVHLYRDSTMPRFIRRQIKIQIIRLFCHGYVKSSFVVRVFQWLEIRSL